MLIPPPADDGHLAARMRFEDPHKFLEFHDKQLARELVGIRYATPVEVGAPITVVISPPDAPDRLRLAGRVERVRARPDGAARLRVRVRPTPADRSWIAAYISGLRAALARVPFPATGPMTAIDVDPTAELVEFAGRMDDATYYGLLGVEPNASPRLVRQRFLVLARQHRPRVFADAPPEIERTARSVQRRLNEAYGVLRHPQRRAAYDRGLGETVPRLRAEESLAIDGHVRAHGGPDLGQRYWQLARDVLERARSAPGGIASAADEALRILRIAQAFAPSDEHIRHAMSRVTSLRSATGAPQHRPLTGELRPV